MQKLFITLLIKIFYSCGDKSTIPNSTSIVFYLDDQTFIDDLESSNGLSIIKCPYWKTLEN